MPRALSLPSLFTHGIRDGENVGHTNPVVGGNLGTTVIALSLAVVPRGVRLV